MRLVSSTPPPDLPPAGVILQRRKRSIGVRCSCAARRFGWPPSAAYCGAVREVSGFGPRVLGRCVMVRRGPFLGKPSVGEQARRRRVPVIIGTVGRADGRRSNSSRAARCMIFSGRHRRGLPPPPAGRAGNSVDRVQGAFELFDPFGPDQSEWCPGAQITADSPQPVMLLRRGGHSTASPRVINSGPWGHPDQTRCHMVITIRSKPGFGADRFFGATARSKLSKASAQPSHQAAAQGGQQAEAGLV